jgi:hypothetical protein
LYLLGILRYTNGKFLGATSPNVSTNPVILGKIRNMTAMDVLIRIFFSNFTIKPVKNGTLKGSNVTYKLKEPWKGFFDNSGLVHGAGTGTLTLDLVLGKDAL